MGKGDVRTFLDFIGQVAGTLTSLGSTVLGKQEFHNSVIYCLIINGDRKWRFPK